MKVIKQIPFFFAAPFIAFVFCFQVNGQNSYSVLNYSSRNGLPQNNIRTMALDSLGFLWMANESGVIRFDGRNFKDINSANNSEIIGNYFFRFFQTLANELLLTDIYGGLYLIENGKLKLLKKGDLNAIDFLDINGILPDHQFYIRYTTPHLKEIIDTNWAYPQLIIFPQSKSNYLIKTKTGIAVYKNYKLDQEISLSGFKPKEFFCVEDDVYFIDENKKIYHIDLKSNTFILCKVTGNQLPDNLNSPQNTITVFYDFKNQCSFITSGTNLFKLKTESNPLIIFTEIITNELPANCLFTSLVYSPQNQFFAISTDSKGIFIYKENKFKTLINASPKAGTSNSYYSQLALDSNRLLTDWGVEFSENGATQNKLPIVRNIAENIFRDNLNNVWYSHGDSLLKYNPVENTIKLISIFKKNRAVCFFQSGDSILIGCLKNIYCYKNDSLFIIGNISRPESNANPFTIFTKEKSKIWFTNIKGAYIFNTQTNTIDTVLPVYQKMIHNKMLYKDYILLGSYGGGYYFHKNGKTVHMPLDKNNYLLNVNSFVADENGFLWMATNRGLFKTKFSDLENYFNDTTTKVIFKYYDETDGIKNLEFNGGSTSSALKLKNGYVSLASMEGLVWFKPSNFIDANAIAPIIIDAVFLDDKIDTTLELVVKSSVENIRIDISTPYWGNIENLFIEYKLDGINKQWKRFNNIQNSIEFSKLHSGNYTLLIRKKTGFETNDFTTTSFSIDVEKKFYETLWFAIILLLGLTGLIAGISRLYAYNIRKKNKILEENVRNRTTELSLANNELQQSVNEKDKLISIISHDVVTPLRFIAMVARKSEDAYQENKNENIQASLSEIKNASEKLYLNAQNILNWIKHQNKRITVNETFIAVAVLADEVIDSLLELSSSKSNSIINGISPDDILKTDEQILYIILHNILTNAIKFTTNGTITIESSQTEKEYIITISDTGSGMNAAQLKRIQDVIKLKTISVANPSSGANGNGLGYVIISELIALLNGKINVESTPDKGTVVTLTLTNKNSAAQT